LLITRREFCQSTATVALATALIGAATLQPFPAFAQATPAVSPEELMRPDALPDMILGDEKAPVTVIEYASATCSHCASFHENTYPELKKRYIDTGKVRFVFREFPPDRLAAAVFMLARCAGETDKDKYFALMSTLFRQQRQWYVEQPIPPLRAIARQAGFTEKSFDACIEDQKLLNGLQSIRDRAYKQFGVRSTPTFFINGTKHEGALSIDEMAKVIDPFLKS